MGDDGAVLPDEFIVPCLAQQCSGVDGRGWNSLSNGGCIAGLSKFNSGGSTPWPTEQIKQKPFIIILLTLAGNM